MKTTVRILDEEPYGVVSPRLYGHFAEHLGRCCYDGLWVGNSEEIPNIGGFRKDVVKALRLMPTPMLRWPGGCYADHYHWRDGIGENRPVRLGLSCGRQVLDDNGLGTHEFLRFCELIAAEPYLAGNMGSGSVQELCDWVEYCNTPLATNLGNERVANGRPAPWDVKLWGVGNENWGCGGNYDPESYALEYRRYASMMQHVDPTIEMVFCGHNSEWNGRSLEKMGNHLGVIDHFSIHRYWINGGPGVDFTDNDYDALIKEADETEAFVIETRNLLEEISGGRKRIGIALDEWGVWHPEARPWGPGNTPGYCGDYTQAGTLRDAIATAVALEGFHRQCASLTLANLAQIVNVLHAPIMTEEGEMWLTPTYHVLRMHAIHRNATAYRVAIEGDASVSATATSAGITLTNRHRYEPATVTIPDAAYEHAELLAADSPSAQNGPGHTRAQPRKMVLYPSGADMQFEMPPHSVATLEFGYGGAPVHSQ